MLEVEQSRCETERLAKASSHKDEEYVAEALLRAEGNVLMCGGHMRRSHIQRHGLSRGEYDKVLLKALRIFTFIEEICPLVC